MNILRRLGAILPETKGQYTASIQHSPKRHTSEDRDQESPVFTLTNTSLHSSRQNQKRHAAKPKHSVAAQADLDFDLGPVKTETEAERWKQRNLLVFGATYGFSYKNRFWKKCNVYLAISPTLRPDQLLHKWTALKWDTQEFMSGFEKLVEQTEYTWKLVYVEFNTLCSRDTPNLERWAELLCSLVCAGGMLALCVSRPDSTAKNALKKREDALIAYVTTHMSAIKQEDTWDSRFERANKAQWLYFRHKSDIDITPNPVRNETLLLTEDYE